MAVDVGSAVGYLDLDISKFLSGLKSAQDEAGKTSTTITDKLDSVGTKFTNVGKKMTVGITTPIVGLSTASVKTAANFESAMSKVGAISGASGKDLEALSDKAKEMGETTKFSASESAEALKYMAMAGWKTNDMLDGLEGIMNLAAASGENLGTTSDIVTDALTAFGLQAKDSSHFADVLAAASSNANTNVSMLGESFKYVAPVAGALGYSAEDTAVALGLMANSGIKASQAGTALRSALTRMVAKTGDAGLVMDQLGIEITNADGSMKDLSEVMDILRDKMGGLSEEEQATAATTIFGQEAMSGMLAIINAAPEDYQKLSDAINNADGTAKEMADTMNDNLNGQMVLLKSQIEGVAIKLGNILMPAIKKVVDRISEWVDWFSKLSESQQTTILKIARIVAVIGPLLLIIGKVITVVSTAIKIINSIKKAITVLNTVFAANPILIVVAAIAALVAIFVVLWNKCEAFRNFWKGLWEEIKKVTGKYIEAIVGFFKSAWEVIQEVWSVVADFFKGIWDAIVETLSPLVEEIVGAFQEAWEVIKLIWDMIAPYVEAVIDGIKNAFSTIAETLGEFFSNAWEAIKFVWDLVVPYFEAIWDGIKTVFSVVANIVGGFFKTAWEVIKTVWDVVVNYFTLIWAGIKAVFSVVKGVLSGDFSDAWEAIKNVWDKAVDFFKAIWEGIKNIFSAVIDWFASIFGSAWDKIVEIWSVVVDFFAGIWDGIASVFEAIGEWFSEKFQSAVDGITSVWSVVTGFFSNVWNGITDIFSGVGSWFKARFQAAWDNIVSIFSGIREFFSNIWETIKDVFSSIGTSIGEAFSGAFKSVVNTVFEWIEDKVNSVIDIINGAISFISDIVPGVDFSGIDYISLPRLAKGGIAYGPTAAIVGDNKNASVDPEVISPLSKLKELLGESFVKVASMMIRSQEIMKDQIVSAIQIIDITPLVTLMEELVVVQKSTKDYMISQKKSEESKKDNEDKNAPPPPSGDTFIFNSPKVIDEEEAANQMRRIKREILEGF